MKKIFTVLLLLMLFNLTYSEENLSIFNMVKGIEVNNILPEFQLYDLDGNKVDMKIFENKAIMLNFWATWCPPCKIEMPSIEELYQNNKDKNFEIVAVSLDSKSAKKVKKFLRKNGYNFPVYYDGNGALTKKFLVRSMPLTYIVDSSGIIVYKQSGAIDWSGLDVDRLVGGN